MKAAKDEMKDFIVDDSLTEESDDESVFKGSDDEDDKFDEMTKKSSLKAKLSVPDVASPKVTLRNPFDDSSDDDDLKNMSKEELDKLMIPTAMDGAFDIDYDPKLDVDGPLDSDSKAEGKISETPKQKIETSESEAAVKGEKNPPAKKLKLKKTVKPQRNYMDSDDSLPEIDSDDSESEKTDYDDCSAESREVREDNKQNIVAQESRSNEETGLKLIIPPRTVAVRGNRQRPSLIICPTSLISHWVDQVETRLYESVDIKLFVHHGPQKALLAGDLNNHDIVITTYGQGINFFYLLR